MASPINKKTLQHLANLARIELNPREEDKLLTDLQKIVNYFDELQQLDTASAEAARPPELSTGKSGAVTGGTALTNVFREDEAHAAHDPAAERAAFPEQEKGFLKVPPVFDRNHGEKGE